MRRLMARLMPAALCLTLVLSSAAALAAETRTFADVMKDPSRTVGFLRKTVKLADGTERIYQVWIPLDYTADKKWPTILFLHGKGEIGTDGEKMLKQGLPKEITKREGKFEFIVVIPQVTKDFAVPELVNPDPSKPRPAVGWTDPKEEEAALAALDATLRTYSCDFDRLYLTGLSMGGYGTYAFILKSPKRWAAAAPICGGGDVGRAADLARKPLWIWHGDADKAVPVENSRKMAEALKAAGATDFKYTELPGVGHNAWDQAYAGEDLWQWFLSHRRVAAEPPAKAPAKKKEAPPKPASTSKPAPPKVASGLPTGRPMNGSMKPMAQPMDGSLRNMDGTMRVMDGAMEDMTTPLDGKMTPVENKYKAGK